MPNTHPLSYTLALENTFSTEQIDAFISSGKPNFVYGSLMFPSILATMIRGDEDDIGCAMTRAVLRGHRRYAVKGADFPAVLASKDPRHSVDGLVVFGLNQEQRSLLDQFESGLYDQATVRIEIILTEGNKRTIDAVAYIWRGEQDDLYEIKERHWAVDTFIQSGSYERWSSA